MSRSAPLQIRDYMSAEASERYDECWARLTERSESMQATLRGIRKQEVRDAAAQLSARKVPPSAYTTQGESTQHRIWPPEVLRAICAVPLMKVKRTRRPWWRK